MDNETKPRQDNERGEQKNNPKHYRKNNKRRNPHHNNRQGNQPNQNPKSGEEKVTAPIQQQNAAQGVDNAQQRQNNNKRRPNKRLCGYNFKRRIKGRLCYGLRPSDIAQAQ